MLALVADPAPRLVRDHPSPVRDEGEALLRVRLAGVCDTDIHITRGYMDHRGVLGHEFVADVLESDDASWVGRRVVADINASCGLCEDCTERDGHHCSTRTVVGIAGRDGAFAELLAVPQRNLVRVPDHVSDDEAVFAEPLAAAAHGVEQLPPGRVIVLGDGKLGLLTVMCLRAKQVPVALVGHHDDNLAIAASVGAETVNANRESLDALREADAVVEATGSAKGLATAVSMVRPRGTVVLKTTVASRFEVDLAPVVVNEVRVLGSRCGNLNHAMALLADGLVDPRPLIRSRYSLEQAEQALAKAGEPASLKVVVKIGTRATTR